MDALDCSVPSPPFPPILLLAGGRSYPAETEAYPGVLDYGN